MKHNFEKSIVSDLRADSILCFHKGQNTSLFYELLSHQLDSAHKRSEAKFISFAPSYLSP